MSNSHQEKLPVSVVIVAKNEEKRLPACLKSCDFASEIIVVDDESTDKTREIALSFGAKVFSRKMTSWGDQQTFAIQQASQPWLFLLDCDEIITPDLAKSIKTAVSLNEDFSYEVKRINRFEHFKATHGTLRPDWVPRLMKNEGVKVIGQVHQKIVFPHTLKKLKGHLDHYTYSDIDKYYEKMNKYCKLSAEKYQDEGRNVNFLTDVVIRPAWAAFKVYFLNLGFLDGKIGFAFAANHYSYTLQKYLRYYLLKKTGGKF